MEILHITCWMKIWSPGRVYIEACCWWPNFLSKFSFIVFSLSLRSYLFCRVTFTRLWIFFLHLFVIFNRFTCIFLQPQSFFEVAYFFLIFSTSLLILSYVGVLIHHHFQREKWKFTFVLCNECTDTGPPRSCLKANPRRQRGLQQKNCREWESNLKLTKPSIDKELAVTNGLIFNILDLRIESEFIDHVLYPTIFF